jgi:uncharacterized tellurite resistance protein B-like protein
MIFGKRTPQRTIGSERIDGLIRAQLPEADEDSAEIVIALTGLLACVAYADRKYTDAEQAHVREALERVQGLTTAVVDTICAALRDHVAEIAASNTQAYTRVLRELLELEPRRELLDVLVDLAASDGELALAETDLLRRAAAAMGLTNDDYVASQARHRERLSVLK